MGILSALLGADNPAAVWAAQNRGWLGSVGAGLGSGTSFADGLAQAAAMGPQGQRVDDAYRVAEEQKAERQRQINQTSEYLRSTFPDLAEAVNAGMPMDAAWNEAMKRKQPGYGQVGADDPAHWREWEKFSQLSPEQQTQYLTMKRSVPFLDTGTEFARPDPLTGQVGPTVAKDNYTPAYDAASGTANAKVDAETQSSFDSLNSKLPGLKTVVDELGTLAEHATYTTTGKLWDEVVRETGNLPTEGALARTKYQAMVDNQILPLLRDTFGAQFTVAEGESLRATLGAPDKTPAEKKAVLEAFIEQKVRDVQALQSRLPGKGGSGAANDPLGIR